MSAVSPAPDGFFQRVADALNQVAPMPQTVVNTGPSGYGTCAACGAGGPCFAGDFPHKPDCPAGDGAAALRKVAQEMFDWFVRKSNNNERFAYNRCIVCNGVWHGPREGRDFAEPERHTSDCPVVPWRTALGATRPPEGL